MDQTLGKRIVANRKRMGMTQDQLAEHLGVTAQAVSKWENDQSCPDITMLPKLAELFGVSVDALLGRQESVRVAEVVTRDEDEEDGKNTIEFKWDSGRKSGLLFGLLIVWVGALTLASKILVWENVDFWDILWPSVLIFWGIGELMKKSAIFGTALTVSGLYFLSENIGILSFGLSWEYLFPILLVVWGIGLLIDALGKPKKGGFKILHNGKKVQSNTHFSTDADSFDCSVSFGEKTEQVYLDRLRSGSINVSFGSATVDLSGCKEVSPDCVIDASCSFGELSLLIPRKYRAVCDENNTSFAEVSVSGHPDADAQQEIRIDARVSFGELNIRYI